MEEEKSLRPEAEWKPSFLIYTDCYMHIMSLTAEERGELFSCLVWYGMVVGTRKIPMTPAAAAASCTSLSPAAKMAFRFMAESIHRDTVQWFEKQKRYKAAAARREAEKRTGGKMPFKGRGVDVYPSKAELAAMEEGWRHRKRDAPPAYSAGGAVS